MNMTLRECKQAIRSFVRQHWDDQRLHDVYAFNRDGKMDDFSCCACLIGCTLAKSLHVESCSMGHYTEAHELPGSTEAEQGYMGLAWVCTDVSRWSDSEYGDALQQRRLSAILRGELRRRDRVRRDLKWAYADRETAILKIASGISYLNVDDLSALCELAEDGGQVLAEMVLNPAISGVRLRGAASAEVAL